MYKTTPVLIAAFSLLLIFSAIDVSSQTSDTSPSPTPKSINQAANVDSLELDRTEILISCPPGTKTPVNCLDNGIINVRTKTSGPENNVLVYNYSVSGGTITGTGENILWNLYRIRAGTYTITASVDDGRGIPGKTITKSITVRECAECTCVHCECAQLEVTSNAESVTQNQIVTFTFHISGGSADIDKLTWTVSNGEIIDGQGTSVIKVDTKGLAGKTIKAMVKVGGTSLCLSVCPTTASTSISVSRAIKQKH